MTSKIITFERKPNKITFSTCGLDIEKNFLQSPECPCGCGGKTRMLLKDKKDISAFIGSVLYENECECCACVVLTLSSGLYFGTKFLEEVTVYNLPDFKKDNFYEIGDAIIANTFHCYGLVVEAEPGEFEIIEE